MICVVKLGGGFKYFLFSPLFGEDSHFDQYFSDGLKPLTSKMCTHASIKSAPFFSFKKLSVCKTAIKELGCAASQVTTCGDDYGVIHVLQNLRKVDFG